MIFNILHRPQQALVLDAIHRVVLTPGAQDGPGRMFNLTGRWSCRDSPVLSHALRGRPFLDLRLKHVKVGSPSPAVF